MEAGGGRREEGSVDVFFPCLFYLIFIRFTFFFFSLEGLGGGGGGVRWCKQENNKGQPLRARGASGPCWCGTRLEPSPLHEKLREM